MRAQIYWLVSEKAVPSKQVVEKKAMFFVSSGFSWVHSGVLLCGSDSPVSDELSTWITHTIHRDQNIHLHSCLWPSTHKIAPKDFHSFLNNSKSCNYVVQYYYVFYLTALGKNDTYVSRDSVSSFDLHQVPDHQVNGIDLVLLPIADHQGLLGERHGRERRETATEVWEKKCVCVCVCVCTRNYFP